MRTARSAALAPLGVLVACASASPPASPASAPAAAVNAIAPPPFTAAQIRDATPAGRTYDFELELPGRPPSGLRLRFVEVTPERARIERSIVDENGEALAPTETATVTWDELVGHAAWPLSATTIEAAHISVPVGEFEDAVLYTVREIEDGKTKVTRAWFARALPGAPVVHVVEVDGHEVSRMRLVRTHVP